MPNTIGRYEITRELGAGGMAVVYLAMDPAMKRQVAIKVLPRQFTFDPQFRTRFNREAQVIASLEHQAIVPVYDYGEHDDQPYIVMRYMPGGSLADRMAKGPLSLKGIAVLLERLAGALDVAHQRGIVHRDLKPANILFDLQGDAYLSDFGIAKLTEASSAFTGSAIIGTPAYMSPEQAGGQGDLDGRSDVYSLAVILFELLTHKLPYEADTPMRQAVAHIVEPIPDILQVNPALPKAIEPLMRQALAKSPRDRYPTAGLFAAALARLAAGRKIEPDMGDNATRKASATVSPAAELLKTARSPAAIAFTGAATIGLSGVILLICLVGFVVASTRIAPTATLTAWVTSSATSTSTSTLSPTYTATATATQSPTLMPTATATLTATPTLRLTRSRPTGTDTPIPTLTDTPMPQCNQNEFFDPLMNRCRTSDSGGGSGGGSGGAGGPVPTLKPTGSGGGGGCNIFTGCQLPPTSVVAPP